jgi:hypothetical protein
MTIDTDKLAKILGMLGSAHDGEALAAARQADAMLRRAGLTWHDVLASPRTAAASGTRPGTGGASDRRWRGFDWRTAAVQRLATEDQAQLVEALLRRLQHDRSDTAVRFLSVLRAELRDGTRTSLARRQAEDVAHLGRVCFG